MSPRVIKRDDCKLAPAASLVAGELVCLLIAWAWKYSRDHKPGLALTFS